jgi:hypothetical protein
MRREVGDKRFPLWLLGDSEPERWQAVLDAPLDPRHPIRHNIWTPVLEVIQDRAFRVFGGRIDTSDVFIRNAVGNRSDRPLPTDAGWGPRAQAEVTALGDLIGEYGPKVILCFGAFSFEFARRALLEEPRWNYGHWGARGLGDEFRRRIGGFDCEGTTMLPMLHRTIAGGKFIQSHEYFCNKEGANYFAYVGGELAEKMIQYRDKLPIWIRVS